MSSLLPGHAHRSSSDRLLNNYLSSQKQLSTALLTLLSHSHSSSSSLLAYVTSSPGVPYTVRRSVQHAAFEGPLGALGGADEEDPSGGSRWNTYLASLETFRKELKDVHTLEEELSQVKRDREILIGRLIKATKSRPSRADLAAMANGSAGGHSHGHSRFGSSASTLSLDSDTSNTTAGGTKRSKRAAKLAEAQAEVLGCEEHLRGLEVQLEVERTKVMKHGLMERFKAMEDVARMWLRQARLGINELERESGREPDMNPNAFELDSNGSLAPSQSASQVGVNAIDHHQPSPHKSRGAARPGHFAGSVTGSIAEEDEDGSSGSEDGRESKYVVHENHPAAGGPAVSGRNAESTAGNGDARRSVMGTGVGIPSVTNMPAPRRANSTDSYHGVAQPRRRTQSEIGVGYKSPTAQRAQTAANRRQSLRRTFSGGNRSDGSSIRSARKKGGFFRSIAKLFKSQPANGRSSRRGDDSPPLSPRTKGSWQTRTDDNIRRVGGPSSRNRDDSSDSEDDMRGGNYVAVSNMGNDKWSVDKVGLVPAPPVRKVTRSDLGAKSRSDSTSTLTPAGKSSKTSGGTKTSTTPRTRQGSITRAPGRTTGSAVGAPSISSVIEKGSTVSRSTVTGTKKSGSALGTSTAPQPKMMEVPKAPRSQVTPQMYTVSAPPRISEPLLQSPPPIAAPTAQKSSAVPSAPRSTASATQKSSSAAAPLALGKPLGGNPQTNTLAGESTDSVDQSTTKLPPSKSLQPPAKSSLRGHAPSPTPGYIVSAPGSVVQDRVEEPAAARPVPQTNGSYAPTIMTADGESVYESANEEADRGVDEGEDSDASDDTAADPSRYKVVENNLGPSHPSVKAVVEETEATTPTKEIPQPHLEADAPVPPATESAIERRKSVRMAVPDSPALPDSPDSAARTNGNGNGASGWNSKVGARRDSSDEEDNSAYAKAKKSLTTSTKRFSGLSASPVKKEKSAKRKTNVA